MDRASIWNRERFPVVYEQGEPKAVLVDVVTFEQVETVLDNLLNRDAEPEDAILFASDALQNILKQARATKPSKNWQQELDEL